MTGDAILMCRICEANGNGIRRKATWVRYLFFWIYSVLKQLWQIIKKKACFKEPFHHKKELCGLFNGQSA